MDPLTKIEDFYGVYLLCSESLEKKYKGKCYIGYTVNPNRRINQHNRGVDFGGARKTNNKGPWKMIMIIHGFPNNISALQFEWAWQSPKISSRLKTCQSLEKKLRNESHFDYNFRILSQMLRTGPWNRLPLIVRWLADEFQKDFSPEKIPPIHMKIAFGPVFIKKKSKLTQDCEINQHRERLLECHLCMKKIENPLRSKITCINPKCILTCHILCLANQCLEPGQYVPIEGSCPICEKSFLWGDLIRKKNGCNDLEEGQNNDDFNNSDLESETEDDDDMVSNGRNENFMLRIESGNELKMVNETDSEESD